MATKKNTKKYKLVFQDVKGHKRTVRDNLSYLTAKKWALKAFNDEFGTRFTSWDLVKKYMPLYMFETYNIGGKRAFIHFKEPSPQKVKSGLYYIAEQE